MANDVIKALQTKTNDGRYRLTFHAEKERDADKITKNEIEESLLSKKAKIIEDYPEDPRGHSCLILGFTNERLPIHMVCGNLYEDEFVIITVYRPDPDEWLNWQKRR